MKKMKKKIPKAFCGILFFLPIMLSAQTIEYTYDLAGNRTLRQVLSISSPSENTTPDTTTIFNQPGQVPPGISETDGAHEIRLFPNPTTGNVNLNVTNLTDASQSGYAVYSTSGVALKEEGVLNEKNIIPFAPLSPGSYILKVKVNGRWVAEFKVVKK